MRPLIYYVLAVISSLFINLGNAAAAALDTVLPFELRISEPIAAAATPPESGAAEDSFVLPSAELTDGEPVPEDVAFTMPTQVDDSPPIEVSYVFPSWTLPVYGDDSARMVAPANVRVADVNPASVAELPATAIADALTAGSTSELLGRLISLAETSGMVAEEVFTNAEADRQAGTGIDATVLDLITDVESVPARLDSVYFERDLAEQAVYTNEWRLSRSPQILPGSSSPVTTATIDPVRAPADRHLKPDGSPSIETAAESPGSG